MIKIINNQDNFYIKSGDKTIATLHVFKDHYGTELNEEIVGDVRGDIYHEPLDRGYISEEQMTNEEVLQYIEDNLQAILQEIGVKDYQALLKELNERRGEISTVTMEQWNEWHELGDVVVVEELLELYPDHEHLLELENDCFLHDQVVENGERYSVFKNRFIDITSRYVKDWKED